MSTNLNYKQVANVSRRTWDVETYEQKAKARQVAINETLDGTANKQKNRNDPVSTSGDDEKEEFTAAAQGAAGPEGSKRAFLKARQGKVEIDSKVGETEIVSAEAASMIRTTTDAEKDATNESSKDNVVTKSGVGWHCKVCDCFLKDSHTYLDHINGRKHQAKLGYSMRVERSTKDQVMETLKALTKQTEKKQEEDEEENMIDYEEMVKAKDERERQRKAERKRLRKERKKRLKEAKNEEEGLSNEAVDDTPATSEGNEGEEEAKQEDGDEEAEPEIDPAMAAMMGFSGFGGGNKNR